MLNLARKALAKRPVLAQNVALAQGVEPNGPAASYLWPRRAFHLLVGSTIPLAVLFLPYDAVLWLLIVLSIAMVLAEAARLVLPAANDLVLRLLPLFKPSERQHITGATFMLLSATSVVALFDREMAVLALFFLSVGDPMAAVVGSRSRRGRVFSKSLAGTAAFAATAGTVGVLVALYPDVPLAWWLLPGVVAAAVTELLPLPLDDNLTVPLVGGTTMYLFALL